MSTSICAFWMRANRRRSRRASGPRSRRPAGASFTSDPSPRFWRETRRCRWPASSNSQRWPRRWRSTTRKPTRLSRPNADRLKRRGCLSSKRRRISSLHVLLEEIRGTTPRDFGGLAVVHRHTLLVHEAVVGVVAEEFVRLAGSGQSLLERVNRSRRAPVLLVGE